MRPANHINPNQPRDLCTFLPELYGKVYSFYGNFQASRMHIWTVDGHLITNQKEQVWFPGNKEKYKQHNS